MFPNSTTGVAGAATVRAIFDFLFPWSCVACGKDAGEPLCEVCLGRVAWIRGPACSFCGLPLPTGPTRPCGRCLRRLPPFASLRAAATYETGDESRDPLALAIRELKYAGRQALAPFLARLLARVWTGPPGTPDLVVPVPLHVARLRERGFNQAALLGRGVARALGLPVAVRALRRVRATPPQVGRGENERRENLRGAILVRVPGRVRGRRILLVDDVATSTATARAATEALLDAGAERVDVLVLARAPLRTAPEPRPVPTDPRRSSN